MAPAKAKPETGTRPEFLTVRELADLLRIGERKVYDLAASGAVPVARVTGKLLFPEREVRAWLAGGRAEPPAARPDVMLGSHDPLLEWALRQSGCGLASRCDGSLDGLRRFAAGEGVASGLHLHEDAGWNQKSVAEVCGGGNAALLAWARRRRGLVVRREEARSIRALADLAGRTVAPRQAESGTQALFERLLAEADLGAGDIDYAETAPSENDAVLAVAQGRAEAAFGLEALAGAYGLAFAPVIEESFDVLVDRAAFFEPPLQRLFDFAAEASFRRHAQGLAGYDVAGLGAVRWNA